MYTQRGAPGYLDNRSADNRYPPISDNSGCQMRAARSKARVCACVRRACVVRACMRGHRRNSRHGHGEPAVRVASIFPDCTTTVVCGCVNRSQSKYICAHIRNAARRTLRLVMQSCASCLAQFRHSLCPRAMRKVW